MSLTQVVDYSVLALDMLLEQFKGKATVEDLLAAIVNPLNSMETDLFAMLNRRISITNSEGAQLTALAKMINVERAGRSDADLRTAIITQIEIHASGGTRNDIISATQNLVQITEYNAVTTPLSGAQFDAHASSGVDPVGILNSLGEELNRRINGSRSAGVYHVLQWADNLYGTGINFRFDTAGRTFDGDDVFRIQTRSSY